MTGNVCKNWKNKRFLIFLHHIYLLITFLLYFPLFLSLFPYFSLFLPSSPLYLPVKKTEINGRGDPLRWPSDTLYPQKLALTSLTSDGRSVGIVRLRTKGHRVWSSFSFLPFIYFESIPSLFSSSLTSLTHQNLNTSILEAMYVYNDATNTSQVLISMPEMIVACFN
jgi:hypothetical protein